MATYAEKHNLVLVCINDGWGAVATNDLIPTYNADPDAPVVYQSSTWGRLVQEPHQHWLYPTSDWKQ